MIEIVEAKEVGILYHFTSLLNIVSIVEMNELKAKVEGYVSFTRDKNFYKTKREIGSSVEASIIIDGNKLSETYKITPYNYLIVPSHYARGEEEERIKGNIIGINKYILGANIVNMDEFKFSNQYNFAVRLREIVPDFDWNDTSPKSLLKSYVNYLRSYKIEAIIND
jgi:hypothetical protein